MLKTPVSAREPVSYTHLKPRSQEEYMEHLNLALSLIPGKNKLALHAIYLNSNRRFVDRDAIEPAHFRGWVDYAKARGIGLDFNPTYFSHRLADEDVYKRQLERRNPAGQSPAPPPPYIH